MIAPECEKTVIPPLSDAPSNAEIAREEDPTRRQILKAMQRILLGHPKHVPPGAISVSDLAKEAQVGRHYLYQSHPDLRERYEYLRDSAGQQTEKETALETALSRTKTELVRMRDLQMRTRKEADDSKGLIRDLSRVVNVLQAELHQEQTKSQRLAHRLRKLEEENEGYSPVVLMHRRQLAEPS